MPPRINLKSAVRSLKIRSIPPTPCSRPLVLPPVSRGFADGGLSTTASSSQMQDGTLVPLSGLSPRATRPVGSTESDSQPVEAGDQTSGNEEALSQLELVAYGLNPFDPAFSGHKYGLPDLPLPPHMNLKKRYEPLIEQITRLLMRSGKLAKAQRDMAMVLNYLRTSSAPKYNPKRPLMPGAPPANHLPLDPLRYFALAVDSVAPLIRIRRFPKLAGGGRALEVPVPIPERARRRQAFKWIMEAVDNKYSKGSGKTMLAHKIGEEVVAVVEGRSPVWLKRDQMHKMGTSTRANVSSPRLLKKK